MSEYFQPLYSARVKFVTSHAPLLTEKITEIQEDMAIVESLHETNVNSAESLLGLCEKIPFYKKQLWQDVCPDLEALAMRKALDLVNPLLSSDYNAGKTDDAFELVIKAFSSLFKKLTQVMPRQDMIYNLAAQLRSLEEKIGMKATFANVDKVLDDTTDATEEQLTHLNATLNQIAPSSQCPSDTQANAFACWKRIVEKSDVMPPPSHMLLALQTLDNVNSMLPYDKKEYARQVATILRSAWGVTDAMKFMQDLASDVDGRVKHADYDKIGSDLMRAVNRLATNSKKSISTGGDDSLKTQVAVAQTLIQQGFDCIKELGAARANLDKESLNASLALL